MEILLEDYKRRLAMVAYMIENYTISHDDHLRLSAKESCYRSIIMELEKAIKNEL